MSKIDALSMTKTAYTYIAYRREYPLGGGGGGVGGGVGLCFLQDNFATTILRYEFWAPNPTNKLSRPCKDNTSPLMSITSPPHVNPNLRSAFFLLQWEKEKIGKTPDTFITVKAL